MAWREMGEGVGMLRRVGANLARAGRRALARASLPRRGGFWLALRVDSVEELPAPRLSQEPSPGLLDLLGGLDAAAGDPDVDGVFLELVGSPGGWSKALSLRRALERVRACGKPVAVWAPSLDAESLLLASAASRVWLPETGSVFLVGLRADAFYLRALLDRIEVRPDVVRIGTHKTAAEALTRETMSPEQREQLSALTDDLFEALVSGVAAGRGLDAQALRELVDRGPFAAPAAVEAGLVDACAHRDEVDRRLAELTPPRAGAPRRALRVEARAYFALRAADPGWRPLLRELPRIAYVVAAGAIHRGSGPRGIASEALGSLVERLGADPAVRGVVLRIDSPGGDALASDLLWRALWQLRREKPVVASLGEVAASGGYYLASAADAIYAEASTVTGSIGVVGGKLNLEGLYRRLGVGRASVERGARAGLLSEARGFTEDERRALRGEMEGLYAAFLERVARGRGLSLEAVERVAQGRVWSGARATGLGLADALGGPLEALREARRRAGLAPGERALVETLPRPRLPRLAAALRWLA
jgi:protease IV